MSGFAHVMDPENGQRKGHICPNAVMFWVVFPLYPTYGFIFKLALYNVIQAFAAGDLMTRVRSLGLAEDNVGYILSEGNSDLLSEELLEKV